MKKRTKNVIIKFLLVAVFIIGSITFATMTDCTNVKASASPLSGYKISGYPKFPKVTQQNYVIVKEWYRSDRVEICFYDMGNKTSKSCLEWRANGSVDAIYGDVINDVKYYLSNDGEWVYMESGNGRVSDHASDILATNLNVVDHNGKVVIKGKPIKYIRFVNSKYNMSKGDSITLKYKTNIKGIVSFSSSDKSVVSVNSKGKISAKKVGKATITVKTDSGKTATCKIIVEE